MINTLLLLATFVWPFGQLLLLSGFSSPLRLQFLDLVALCLFLAIFLPSKSRQKAITDPLTKPLFLFAALALFSLVLAPSSFVPDQIYPSLLYLLRFVAYSSFYFTFRQTDIRKYSRFFLLSAFIFLVIGFLQYFLLPDTRYLKYLGFDDHYFRLIGSFVDPNFSGLIFAIFALLSSWPVLLAPLLALGLTFSRASFVALAAGLLYLCLVRRQFRLLLVLLLLGLFVYLVPKPFGEGVNLRRTFSITSRIDNQKSALDLFTKHPLFGVGFNTLKVSTPLGILNLSSGVDNSFLLVLATTGLVGFTAFLYFLKTAWDLSHYPPARAGIIAIFTHSLFNNSFFYSWVLVIFFLLVALPVKKSA